MKRHIILVLAYGMFLTGLTACTGGCDASAGTAVAITGGSAAAAHVGAQALTGSAITVMVDTFDDTGHPEFDQPELGARFRQSAHQGLTADKATQIHRRLREPMKRLRESMGRVDSTLEIARKSQSSAKQGVENDLNALQCLSSKVLAAWDVLDRAVSEAQRDGTFSPGELADLSPKLLHLQSALGELHSFKASGDIVGFLGDEVRNRLETALEPRMRAENGLKRRLTDALATPRSDHGMPVADRLAGLVARAMPLLKEAETPPRVDGKVRALLAATGIQEVLEESRASARSVQARILPDLVARFVPVLAPPGIAAEAETIICDYLLSDVNLGPIRQEFTQMVLSPQAINTVMNPNNCRYWYKEFSKVGSSGITGNHNAVIYMENMARPVLKNAVFDPTKFIVANGVLFRKTFNAMVNLYGLPGGTPLEDANGIVPSVHTLDAQRQIAVAEAEAATAGIKAANDEVAKRQEAHDKEESFKKAQDAAKETVTAEKAADEAQKALEAARKLSETVSSSAKTAKGAADAAKAKADEALKNDATAVACAKDAAGKALEAATAAKNACDEAKKAAEGAKDAEAAKKVEAAAEGAKKALDSAEKAGKDAEAQKAKEAAENAKMAADEATKAATEAVAATTAVVAGAEKAAETAKGKAADARKGADVAAAAKAKYVAGVRKALLTQAAALEGVGKSRQ